MFVYVLHVICHTDTFLYGYLDLGKVPYGICYD